MLGKTMNNRYMIYVAIAAVLVLGGYFIYQKYMDYESRIKRMENEVLRLRNMMYNSVRRPDNHNSYNDDGDEDEDDSELEEDDEDDEDEEILKKPEAKPQPTGSGSGGGGSWQREPQRRRQPQMMMTPPSGLMNMLGGGLFDQIPNIVKMMPKNPNTQAYTMRSMAKEQPQYRNQHQNQNQDENQNTTVIVVDDDNDDDDDMPEVDTFDMTDEQIEEEGNQNNAVKEDVGLKKCTRVLKSGKRKGEPCGKFLDENGLCSVPSHRP